jgi:hypothetical protein
VCLDFFFPKEKEYTLVYIMSLIYIYLFHDERTRLFSLSLSSLGVHFGVDAAKRTRANNVAVKMIGGGFELFFEV